VFKTRTIEIIDEPKGTSIKLPKCLFPDDPEPHKIPSLGVAILAFEQLKGSYYLFEQLELLEHYKSASDFLDILLQALWEVVRFLGLRHQCDAAAYFIHLHSGGGNGTRNSRECS
jgi:hypothetical protein